MNWYHLNDENEVVGPLSDDDLRERLRSGSLSLESQVCREGTEEWGRLSDALGQEGKSEGSPEEKSIITPRSKKSGKTMQENGRQAKAIAWIFLAGVLAVGTALLFVSRKASAVKEAPYHEVETVASDPNAEEIFRAGLRYFEGEKFAGEANLKNDVEIKDFDLAFENFLEAASLGHSEAKYYLAVCFVTGSGTEIDLSKANKYLSSAADQGLGKASYMLGVSLINGEAVEKDEVAGLERIGHAADLGEPDAQWFLALRYLRGEGVPLNQERGVSLLKKAAEQKHAQASYDLALCYEEGTGVENDPAEAARHLGSARMATFHLAKEGGTVLGADHPLVERDPEKQVDFGLAYIQGSGGLVESERNAVYLFRKAAERGNRRGEYCLGYAYSIGSGVEVDHDEAVKWLEKSANQDWPAAQFQLGECYFWGHGVAKDERTALALFEKALPHLLGSKKALCSNRISVIREHLGSNESGLSNGETAVGAPQHEEGAPSIQIISATYGTRGKFADVTEKVKQYIEVEQRSFRVDVEALGVDPFPRRKKDIQIRYSIDGQTFELWWKRNWRVSIEALFERAEKIMESQ